MYCFYKSYKSGIINEVRFYKCLLILSIHIFFATITIYGNDCCCNSCKKNVPTSTSKKSISNVYEDGYVVKNSRIDNIVDVYNYGGRNDDLVSFSIFDYNNKNLEAISDLVKRIINHYISKGNLKEFRGEIINDLTKRAIGTFFGMTIGDSRGAPYEFKPVVEQLYDSNNYSKIDSFSPITKNKFYLEYGQWTDDTSMGLCIADSLIINKGTLNELDIMHRFLSWWKCGYNNGLKNNKGNRTSNGLGGNISLSFDSFIKNSSNKKTTAGDKYTSGNGSIMRNAAIPVCFHNNLNKALEAAEKQNYITHQGIEAAECCKLLTYIVFKIFEDEGKSSLKDILNEVSSNYKSSVKSVQGLIESKENVDSFRDKNKKENWNWKAKTFEYNKKRVKKDAEYIGSFVMDNMAMSLHILYYTNSFKQAIDVSSKLCGDADSVSAVVGQIAGAYYSLENIPVEWIKDLLKWDDNYEIALRAYLLAKINDDKYQ